VHHHLCRGIPPNLGDINRTRTTRPTPEPRIRQRECRRGDIRQRRRRSLRRRAMLNPCSPHGRDPCRRAMQEENDQSNRNPLKFGPHAPDHLPSTPGTCAPSPPSFASVASPERRHVPAHRRRPLTPSTPAARSKLGIQGRRDDDDAAWLLVRLQRSTSGPDALGVAAARRRRARTCSLEAPHVDDSSSGAGPVGARSQWRTWLGSRYSSIRAGETGNSAHGGDLRHCAAPANAMGTVATGGRRTSVHFYCTCARGRATTGSMMSDYLNLLGSLKAPMFLELNTYAEDALRELNNTLAQCLHLKCHEQMRNRPLGSPRGSCVESVYDLGHTMHLSE